MSVTYATPTVPFSVADLVNRAAAATGSLRTAAASAGANYNGKLVRVDKGIHKGPKAWRAHYTWAGLRWLTRGATLETALRIATGTSVVKARGGKVTATFDAEPSAEEKALLASYGLLPASEAAAKDAEWKDGRYGTVGGTGLAHIALGLDKRGAYGKATAALLALPAGVSTKDAYNAITDAAYAR